VTTPEFFDLSDFMPHVRAQKVHLQQVGSNHKHPQYPGDPRDDGQRTGGHKARFQTVMALMEEGEQSAESDRPQVQLGAPKVADQAWLGQFQGINAAGR